MRIILLVAQLSMIASVNALEVSLNGSENLPLVGDIVYSYQNNPSSIAMQIDAPIVCSSITAANPETLVFAINDGNNLPLSTLNHNILSIIYDFSNNITVINTDSGIQCATQNGMLNFGTLFNNGFENADLQLQLTDGSGVVFPANITFSDQDELNYRYVISNNGDTTLAANLQEYYQLDNNNPFFSGATGNDWTCVTANTAAGSTSTCGNFANGNGFVNLQDALVDAGEQLIINVARTVEVPAGSSINTIELLGVVFNQDNLESNSNNNIVLQVFGAQ